MPPSPIEGGYVIGGKYQLVRLLGRGSMGEVWIAHHKTLGEDVAVKLLAPAYAASETESYPTASAAFVTKRRSPPGCRARRVTSSA